MLSIISSVNCRAICPRPSSSFQHMSPENTADALIHKLSRHRSFHCRLAKNGDDIAQGYYQRNFANDGQRFVAWYLQIMAPLPSSPMNG
jgi:hypothetical protein